MSNSQTTDSAKKSNSVNDTSVIAEQFSSVLNTLSSFKSQISMLSAQVKALEKKR